ncbi:inactive serine/threonine-protein kinase TEX14-like isoform X2 [Osmerus eperlanus]|uniref:inactive serine/threonine-protein kinase TEX14-like isoform X2 n=1 Tax=Osmerus eperlanus TaxID=29151 RepID=UPI002E0D2E33
MATLPVPCPVRFGVVKSGGLQAQLHRYTLDRNLHKLEKLLKKGVDVDCVNHLGQTPLYCAALLGLTSVTELLLQYGADPNHRCEDRSTPVHSAVFSCNPWLVSGLLDAGGDLRLHDCKGRSPRDWAEAGAQENSARMLEFLKSCVSHMHSLSHIPQSRLLRRTPSSTSTSSKNLVRSPSLLEVLKSGGSDLYLNRKMNSKSSPCDTVQCFGFGKLCIEKPGQTLGLLASLPVMGDSELGQAEDEALLSFSCGPFITMTNQLFHPHLLQLMAVSMSADFLRVRLVFERVHVGSLHNLLHQKRAEFPVLRAEALLSVVLQACEALLYLHGRGLVMRGLSSHSIILTHPGLAKLTGLGFMVSSEGSCPSPPAPLPLAPGMYNWAAPEVVRCRPCTGKADLYSLCAIIQELYTDAVPWGLVDPRQIRQVLECGQALAADPRVPQPYNSLVRVGLQSRPQDRTHSLQDLRYTLRCDIKELVQNTKRRSGVYTKPGLRAAGWSPESSAVGEQVGTVLRPTTHPNPEEAECASLLDTTVDREIHDQLSQLDRLLDGETEDRAEGERPGREEEDGTSTESESLIDREISYRDILPLDDWRLCPAAASSDPESTEEESDSSTVEEDGDSQEEGATERAVWHERLSRNISEDISSIVLNLKVSQVLLQQSESSLDAVDRDRPLPDAGGADEVDGEERSGKASSVPPTHSHPSTATSTLSSSTLSGSPCSTASRAVGPPAQYRLLPRGLHPSAKRLEARLLEGGGLARPLLSQEELAVWQREYPAEAERPGALGLPSLDCPSYEDATQEFPSEEPSQYSSAREESFVITRPRNKQQAAGGRRPTDTDGTQPQRSDAQRQSVDGKQSKERPCLSSDGTDSLEEDSPTPQPKPTQPLAKARWTSEVSDLVARMTRGHLGTAPGPPLGSSDSEDVEERLGRGSALAPGPPRARREPPWSRDACRPSTSYSPAGPPPPRATEEEGQSGSELEQIFKSFAGVQSESEEDADFHSVNRTFNMTCGVWEDTRPGEEDGTSESDQTQSPVEPSSIFYTPDLQQRNKPLRSSQTSSSEEDLDVTVEVCRPAASQSGPGEQTQEPKKHRETTLDSEIGANRAINEHVPFPLASGFPNLSDLAELSSITCSPGQLQDWVDQEKQPPSPLNRRPPPCNSTPRSPAAAGHCRGLGSREGPVPPLPSLLDTSPWGSSHSLPPHTQSYTTDSYATATGSMGDSTTTASSLSSVLQSPLLHGSSPEETDTPTGPPDFTTASSGERQTTSQEGMFSSYTLPTTTEGGGKGEEGMEMVEEEDDGQDEEVRSVDLHRRQGGTRDGATPDEEEGNEEGEEQGSGGDATSMEEEPVGTGLADPDEELEREEEEEEKGDEESLEEEDVSGEENATFEEDERRLLEEEACDRPIGVADTAARVHQSQARGPPAGPEYLEETDRAHSTLDEVLQCMLVDRAGGQRVRSPGPVQHLKPPVSVCEPQAEGEEDVVNPGGDCVETAEAKRDEIADTAPVPVAGMQEMASLGTWSQPHRVIVLEQTPVKSQSVPNQVMRE